MQARDICVVGVGGGGAQVVAQVAAGLREPPTLCVVDTDADALARAAVPAKLQVGQVHAKGVGTGGDVHQARLAATDGQDLIAGLVDGAQLVVVVTCLGGGTGTGITPFVLRAAREQGAMTLCFATQPFSFEGRDRRITAERAIASLRQSADAVVVVPNDRLFAHGQTDRVDAAFAAANTVLARGVCAMWKILTQPGYLNLTFADLRHLYMRMEGVCSLGYAEATGPDKAATAVEKLLQSPLTENGRTLENARMVLVSIVGGTDLALKEVGDVMNALRGAARADCRMFLGTVIDEEWRNRITLTVVPAEHVVVDEEAPSPVAASSAGDEIKPARRRRRKAGEQVDLGLEVSGKGRFKGVEPTILDGEDLDTPSFIRRGISIER